MERSGLGPFAQSPPPLGGEGGITGRSFRRGGGGRSGGLSPGWGYNSSFVRRAHRESFNGHCPTSNRLGHVSVWDFLCVIWALMSVPKRASNHSERG